MRRTAITVLILATVIGLSQRTAEAGCGCAKPPPPPAAIRPNAAYAGAEVTFFDPSLQPGAVYTVIFTSGVSGATATAQGTVAVRRDQADSQPKPQLVVTVPVLPLGPTRITVSGPGAGPVVLALNDAAFTVVPAPVVVPGWNARMEVKNFQAAVGRDGTFYFALDMTHVDIPLTFQVRANKYPLRFGTADVMFYNVQGFLMQLLTGGIPGLAVVDEDVKADQSNALQYSRHEFTTYFLEHAERQPHALDPTDPRWHLDGTPHVDHNHLIVAITGHLQGSGKPLSATAPYNALPTVDAPPVPGATPPFDLEINTSGLFNYGVVGLDGVTIAGAAAADSEVVSNQTVALASAAIVSGDITADTVTAKDTVSSVGKITTASAVDISGQAYVKTKLTSNGNVKLHGKSQTYGNIAGYDVLLNERAIVYGNVSGLTVSLQDKARLLTPSGSRAYPKTGSFTPIAFDPNELLPVYLPATTPSSGDLVVPSGEVVTLTGPATYRFGDVTIESGGTLAINNAAGAVTFYVTGVFQSADTGQITVANPDADTFSIYVAGGGDVVLPGTGTFVGVVYAPQSSIDIHGTGHFEGAFVGRAMKLSGQATLAYAEKLGTNKNMRATVQALEAFRQTVAKATADAKASAATAASAATLAQAAAQQGAAQAATTVVEAAHTAAAAAASYAVAATTSATAAATAASDAQRAFDADAKANDTLNVTAAEFAADDATVAAAAAAAAAKAAVTAQKNASKSADTAIKATQSAESAALKSAASAQKAALGAAASAQTAATAAAAAATAAKQAAATAVAFPKSTVIAASATAQSAATAAAQAAVDAKAAATASQSAAATAASAAAKKDPASATAAALAAAQGQTAAGLAAKTALTAQKTAESYAATAAKAAASNK